MIEVRQVDPLKEDLRYLDGPWDNGACMGYAIMAMERAGFGPDKIRDAIQHMMTCFDDTTVEEARRRYERW